MYKDDLILRIAESDVDMASELIEMVESAETVEEMEAIEDVLYEYEYEMPKRSSKLDEFMKDTAKDYRSVNMDRINVDDVLKKASEAEGKLGKIKKLLGENKNVIVAAAAVLAVVGGVVGGVTAIKSKDPEVTALKKSIKDLEKEAKAISADAKAGNISEKECRVRIAKIESEIKKLTKKLESLSKKEEPKGKATKESAYDDYYDDDNSEAILYLYEAAANGDITDEERDEAIEMLEGANTDARRAYKEFKKFKKMNAKEIKALCKSGNFDEARAKLTEAKATMKEMRDQVMKIDSTVGEVIIGNLLETCGANVRLFVSTVVTIPLGGVGGFVSAAKTIINEIDGLVSNIKEKSFSIDSLNSYKNRFVSIMNNSMKLMDRMAKDIDKAEAKSAKKIDKKGGATATPATESAYYYDDDDDFDKYTAAMYVYEAAENGDITEEERDEALAMLEGVNTDISNKFNEIAKSNRMKIREIKDLIKAGDTNAAKAKLAECRADLDEAKKEVMAMDSSVGETVIGVILMSVLNYVKALAAGILTLGIGAFVSEIVDLIHVVDGVLTSIKAKDFSVDTLNLYKAKIIGAMNHLGRVLDNMERKIADKVAETKGVRTIPGVSAPAPFAADTAAEESAYYDDDNSEAILYLYEAAENGDITEYERDEAIAMLEGTNTDIKKMYKAFRSTKDVKMKQVRAFIKSGNYKEAGAALDEIRAELSAVKSEIIAMESSAGEAILGTILRWILSDLKALLLAIIAATATLGISGGELGMANMASRMASGASYLTDIIHEIDGIAASLKEKSFSIDTLNLYKAKIVGIMVSTERALARTSNDIQRKVAAKSAVAESVDLKIAIYESAANGEIDEDERELLLSLLD